MSEKIQESIECPSCQFTYKKLTPFGTLVRACPGCGVPAPGGGARTAPKGASRFIPRIPSGMVPKSDNDAKEASKPGNATAIETAAAAPAPGGFAPPMMPTPPPQSGPFAAATAPGEVEVPICFGDPEVFQKGLFCPNCHVYEKCFPRVLVITLHKMVEKSTAGS